MKIGTFVGGIHPKDNKHISKNESFIQINPNGQFAFLLSQHIGAPATPVVNVGDAVKKGQLIAEKSGFVSANIYSSINGEVKAIKPRLTPTGMKVDAIIIDPIDSQDGDAIKMPAMADLNSLTRDDIINRISDAGIVGMGGAGFPTNVKLMPKDTDSIEYIIINSAECEPYLTTDYRRIIENADELVTGSKILKIAFPKAKIIFAIEDNKKDCIKLLKEKTKDISDVNVVSLHTKYPQGSERQLIYVITKRSINSKMLPADAKAIVDNIETLYNIEEAVIKGMPLINRTMTISGDCGLYKNIIVPIGMSQEKVIESLGGFGSEPRKLISGGPMMGFAMYDLDVPVTKTSSAILAFKNNDVSKVKASNCINCARCVEVCPARLIPSHLARLSDNNHLDEFVEQGGLECVECGCCSYVCPAKRHLKQSISSMRKIALAQRKK